MSVDETHHMGGTWGEVVVAERPQNMAYESGGQGLWSTVDDYLKLARLFLGSGTVDGVRLLRPETLGMMMTNQLTDAQRASFRLLGLRSFAVGRGFGLGVSVVLETDKTDLMRRGSPGTVVVDLAQMAKGIGLGVWGVIDEFQTTAMAME